MANDRLRILWLLSSCSYHRMLQKAMATDESYTSRALPFVSRARARCDMVGGQAKTTSTNNLSRVRTRDVV